VAMPAGLTLAGRPARPAASPRRGRPPHRRHQVTSSRGRVLGRGLIACTRKVPS
jgi:hypothetical protein